MYMYIYIYGYIYTYMIMDIYIYTRYIDRYWYMYIYKNEYNTCRKLLHFWVIFRENMRILTSLGYQKLYGRIYGNHDPTVHRKTCPRNISSTDHVHVPKAIFHVFNAHALADVCGVQGFPVLLSPQMLIVASKVWQETTQERDLYVREWMVSNKSSIWIHLMVEFPKFAIHIRLV